MIQINDLYSFLALVIALLAGLVLLLYGLKDFRLPVLLFLLTPLISSLFYKNEVIWTNVDLETGYGGYVRGLIIIFCLVIGFITFVKKWPEHKGKISVGFLLWLTFIIYAAFTLTYTLDAKYTAVRSFFFLGIFFFILGLDKFIQSDKKIDSVLNVIFYTCVFTIILCFFSLAYPPRSWWWKAPRFIGLFSHPNQLGAFIMLSYPIILWKYYNSENDQRNRWFALIILMIAVTLHLLTGSRTTILGSVVGVSSYLFIKRKTVKLVATTGIVGLLAFILLFVYTPENLTRGSESSALTVTGRDVIWEGAIIRFTQKPFFGYGYMVESKILNLKSMQGTTSLASAQQPLHNGYLSIITGTGLVGFLLWIAIISYPLYRIARIRKSNLIDYKAYVVSLMSMVFIANFFESFLTGYIGNGGDLFFWFAWIIGIKIAEHASKGESDVNIYNRYSTINNQSWKTLTS